MTIRPLRGPLDCTGLVAIGLAIGLASAGPTRAGETPATALSESQLTPGRFLDQPSLVFEFPQRAAQLDSRILTTSDGPSSYNFSSSGAVGRFGAQGIFLLTQPFRFSAVDRPGDLVQIGWAGAWGGVRVGSALRVGHQLDENSDLDLDNGEIRYESKSDIETTLFEGAVGIGFDAPFLRADLVVEAYREDANVRVSSISSNGNTTSFRVVSDPPILPKVGLRMVVPIGSTSSVIVTGTYRETTIVRDVEGAENGISTKLRSRSYGHRWNAGLAWETAVSAAGLIRFHGLYSNVRTPTSHTGRGLYRVTVRETADFSSDRVDFGMSLQRPLPYDLTMLAGFRSTFLITREEDHRIESDLDEHSNGETEETLFEGFAWGLAYSWRNLDLVGSVRKDLAVSDPLLWIDAGIRF